MSRLDSSVNRQDLLDYMLDSLVNTPDSSVNMLDSLDYTLG